MGLNQSRPNKASQTCAWAMLLPEYAGQPAQLVAGSLHGVLVGAIQALIVHCELEQDVVRHVLDATSCSSHNQCENSSIPPDQRSETKGRTETKSGMQRLDSLIFKISFRYDDAS